jgi:hypothetical protein
VLPGNTGPARATIGGMSIGPAIAPGFHLEGSEPDVLEVDANVTACMIAFRQLLFHKVVQILRQVGLLSDGVRELLGSEGLARPEALRVRVASK